VNSFIGLSTGTMIALPSAVAQVDDLHRHPVGDESSRAA